MCWRINEIRKWCSNRVNLNLLGDGLVVLMREDEKNGESEVKHVEENIISLLLSSSSVSLLLYTTNPQNKIKKLLFSPDKNKCTT